MDALEYVYVHPEQRVLVWDDGTRRSIADTAHSIHSRSGLPFRDIEAHVIGWLEMHYEPKGLTDHEMNEFEAMIDSWIEAYKNLRDTNSEAL